MRLIKNKPDDPLAHKCGHGVSIRECQYQYCTARDLLKLAETQIELIRGALLNKEVSCKESKLEKDNLLGLWKTVDGFFVIVESWTENNQQWHGRVIDDKGADMAYITLNSKGDEDPPNQGFGYLKKRAPENHMQGTCSKEFWPPVGVEIR